MARPVYNPESITAREKLIASFWEALTEAPYGSIGVRELSRRAGLNKNTFYYHFETLDDLAQQAVGIALPREFGAMLLTNENAGFQELSKVMRDPLMEARLEKIEVLLSDNALALQGILKKRLMGSWQALLGIERFDDKQSMLVSFAASGLIGALQGKRRHEYTEVLLGLFETDAVRHCVSEIAGWKRGD